MEPFDFAVMMAFKQIHLPHNTKFIDERTHVSIEQFTIVLAITSEDYE